MSDEMRAKDPGAIWRDQPGEEISVNLKQIVSRRTEELSSSTRSEILMSILSALLFVGVMAWRIAPRDPLQWVGFGAVIGWVAISLIWFRRRIWRPETSRPDTVAAPGLEYYRRELERRRDHLRNAWVWHGPLVLACLMLAAILIGRASPGWDRLPSALPLMALLVVWTGYGFWRRHRQAQEIQREIEELATLGA